MPMSRNDFKKELQEGLNTVFGLEYKRYAQEWPELYTVEQSRKAYEEDVLLVGLGPAQVKDEGQGVHYDAGGESWTARYEHETIALAFSITEEAEEDNLYGAVGAKYSRALARSMVHTKEVRGVSTLNNGFDSAYTYGDGVELFATNHPLWGGGTFRNEPSTPVDLSEVALEAACNDIEDFEDDRGIPIACRGMKLVIPNALQFTAERLLMSPGRPGTADNDLNAMRSMGFLPQGYRVNHRLTDNNAWFIITDCPDGLKHMRRTGIRRGVEGDFETGNMRYKARERYSNGVTNPRGAWGSPGGS